MSDEALGIAGVIVGVIGYLIWRFSPLDQGPIPETPAKPHLYLVEDDEDE